MYIYIHVYIVHICINITSTESPFDSRAPEGCDFPQLSELQGMFGVLGHRRVSVTPGEARIGSWVAGWLGGWVVVECWWWNVGDDVLWITRVFF